MISEFSIATLLVMLPLIGGGTAWFNWELDKSKCAFQSFANARRELIWTGEKAYFPVQIGSVQEKIELLPLKDLDQGPSGLTPSDLGSEVSQLSEDASRFYRQLRDLGSTKSSPTLKI